MADKTKIPKVRFKLPDGSEVLPGQAIQEEEEEEELQQLLWQKTTNEHWVPSASTTASFHLRAQTIFEALNSKIKVDHREQEATNGRGCSGMPGYLRDPQKWTCYSLDSGSGEELSNEQIAMDFLGTPSDKSSCKDPSPAHNDANPPISSRIPFRSSRIAAPRLVGVGDHEAHGSINNTHHRRHHLLPVPLCTSAAANGDDDNEEGEGEGEEEEDDGHHRVAFAVAGSKRKREWRQHLRRSKKQTTIDTCE